MSQKQLAALKTELQRLEKRIAELQSQNALGSALPSSLGDQGEDREARGAVMSRLDDMREELARLEAKVMAGHTQGYVLGTTLNQITELRRQLQAQEQAQSISNNVSLPR
jgi:archaellum component FlaC